LLKGNIYAMNRPLAQREYTQEDINLIALGLPLQTAGMSLPTGIRTGKCRLAAYFLAPQLRCRQEALGGAGGRDSHLTRKRGTDS
jgi:hypothetical protein